MDLAVSILDLKIHRRLFEGPAFNPALRRAMTLFPADCMDAISTRLLSHRCKHQSSLINFDPGCNEHV